MPLLKPIMQSKASDEVLAQLKQAIILGHYKAGERLPSERDMSEQFEVSRGVVREAVRALELNGFLTVRRGVTGGAFVNELTFKHLDNAFMDLFKGQKLSVPDLAQVRLDIELKVVQLACANATDEQLIRLSQALEDEYQPVDTPSERIARLTAVHYLLAEMCGNKVYEAVQKSLLALTIDIVEVVEPDHNRLHSPGEHRPIVEAVLARDPDAAHQAMKEHFTEFTNNLVRMEEAYRQRTTGQY